ncbi:MAG TPA: hypothetical protein DCE23_03505 [Firmicutes bacterium]|nr:hypothetical protein [Bacillota bacterium]
MTDNKIIKIGTFFSGIGAPEKALERLKSENYIDDYKVQFFSEIDKNAIKSYCAIHNVNESLNLGSITDVKGNNLPYCDLWVGGFPCQDISCAGKMRGFNFESSTRSSLGWEMIRLLREVKNKPKCVIFENVAMITSKKFKDTLNLFKEDLMSLGYTLYDDLLCATDYEIPQTRTRYFLVAILDNNKEFRFPKKIESDVILENLLEESVNEKYYLTNSNYVEKDNKRIFKHKNRNDIEYEVDMDKYFTGGVCGIDKHTKFAISSRLFSIYGNSPTLTASNTADNSKIVIESEAK